MEIDEILTLNPGLPYSGPIYMIGLEEQEIRLEKDDVMIYNLKILEGLPFKVIVTYGRNAGDLSYPKMPPGYEHIVFSTDQLDIIMKGECFFVRIEKTTLIFCLICRHEQELVL